MSTSLPIGSLLSLLSLFLPSRLHSRVVPPRHVLASCRFCAFCRSRPFLLPLLDIWCERPEDVRLFRMCFFVYTCVCVFSCVRNGGDDGRRRESGVQTQRLSLCLSLTPPLPPSTAYGLLLFLFRFLFCYPFVLHLLWFFACACVCVPVLAVAAPLLFLFSSLMLSLHFFLLARSIKERVTGVAVFLISALLYRSPRHTHTGKK